uniref:Uncharacterized protein n=1 Tax=Sarcophilus harrisii TaxID=9305 RepID=A0A7N4PSC4_SARHA
MCTPLLLQDKANLVEDYVADYPHLQSQLLQIMDTWCHPSFNTRDIARQYQNVPPSRADKLNQKMLSKLVFRLLGQYNLDPGLCPNVMNQRHLGALRYLFYKRFVEVCLHSTCKMYFAMKVCPCHNEGHQMPMRKHLLSWLAS